MAARSFLCAISALTSCSNCCHAQVELVLDEVHVGLRADEIAAGKQHLPHLALMQVIAQFLVADAEAHAVGFIHQSFLRDHALGSPLHQIRHDAGRNVALELLPSDETRLLRNFLHADFLVADLASHAGFGEAAGRSSRRACRRG